ncbi:MAG: TetR family transcriptional regulator [Phaeodactylibacter sp.]|nr:TetR family transcriptional regulator [Phaeodactylibacter sp.]
MSTKDKILAEGLRQLNENGTAQVSIRSIADALSISSGNLTYHFKNTDVIIYELYLQLVDILSAGVSSVQEDELDFKLFYNLQLHYFGIMWEYRFLLIDFVAITRRNPRLREHFRQLFALRQMQFRAGIDRMVQVGFLKQEWTPGLYDEFVTRLLLLTNAWIPDSEVHLDGPKEKKIAFYAVLVISSFVPYLSDRGLQEYEAFRSEMGFSPFRGYQTR